MIDILMPRLSDTMTEGAVAAWHKRPGDAVAPGDLLVEIETDKALMEQEAYDAGILAEILVAEGENAAIGTPIARLDDGSGPAPRGDAGTGTADPAPAPARAATPEVAETSSLRIPARAEEDTARRPATPLVRRLARERGIELATLRGTGPGGRIVRADLDALDEARHGAASASAGPATRRQDDARASESEPFDAVRQQIARRLSESAAGTPTFTATASAAVGELMALRARINDAQEGTGIRVSLNDLLVRAVALALRAHPGVNASYSGEGRGATIRHSRVHVGIAVASPAGLVVPVIPDADRAAVTAISAVSRELVAKAAERRLTAAEMSDGTFTISNLGMFGVESFTAIINPPQGAILAVGAVSEHLALVDGEVVAVPRLRVTLTADHRIIDGALAAQFLATLSALLEEPLRIVA